MFSLKISIEIKTNLLYGDSDAPAFLDEIQSEWKKLLDFLVFESQFDRYSQGVCDCDHVQHHEWCYLAISANRDCREKQNVFYFSQILQGYCGLIQSSQWVYYCTLKFL